MAYIGFAPTGKIVRMTLGDGAVSEYSAIPTPAKDKGFMTGLEFDSSGQLYAALASFVEKPQAGIYRISASDNTAKLFAKHDQMKFPNGMAFAPNGDLYVTDSGAGAVFKVAPNGATSAWISHDLLKGEKDYCGKGVGASFDIGANGIVIVDGKIYVANNDRATIVRIPIQADGNAATPQVVAGPDCSKLGGADGLVADSRGNLILAVNRQNRIVRITPSGATETLAEGGDLDFPASVALSGAEVIATNFALFNAMSGKPGKPGIISLPYAN
jgi:sugar lactone lactonase YvrE